jgi:hypothetical protein
MDPHAHGQANAVRVLQAGIQRLQGCDHPQTALDSALRIVFMRLGIAKVDEEPIT